MSTQITVNAQIRRAEIEAHIRHCRNEALRNLVEIGRWLNTAKQEGVVPHGQWMEWAQEHSGLSERDMQRAMQIARELPEGSPLERLGVMKISALLTLPAAEREEFAERIGADKLSSREVDAAVKAARAERDEALRVLSEKKRAFSEKADQCKDQARLLREADRKIVAIESELREKTNKVNSLNLVLAQRNSEADYLREQLEQQKQHKAAPDPETERKIALLEAQIKSRDAAIAQRELEIDRLSDELDAAQTAAMRGGMTGGGDKPSPSTTILSAIGALMAQAGRAPGELARLQGMDVETREILCGQARLVGQWAMQILAACGEGEAHV